MMRRIPERFEPDMEGDLDVTTLELGGSVPDDWNGSFIFLLA